MTSFNNFLKGQLKDPEVKAAYDSIERRNSMKLNDTVKLMKSEDWKDRFRAEYWQTVLRYDALHQMCVKYAAGTLDFEPNCSLDLLKQQRSIMSEYLDILEIRSQIEGVDLGVEE